MWEARYLCYINNTTLVSIGHRANSDKEHCVIDRKVALAKRSNHVTTLQCVGRFWGIGQGQRRLEVYNDVSDVLTLTCLGMFR